MVEPPSKRRKMRPNNAIAVEQAAKTETFKKEKLEREKLAQEQLQQEKSALEKVNEEKLNQEQRITEENNKKDKKNKEKKNKSKKEKKDKSKKEKSEKTASKRKSKEKEQPVTKKSKLDDKKDDSPEQPIIPKLSTPVPTPYTSASDSDETDNEKRPAAKKSAPAPAKKSVISKPAPPVSQLSASDSDETDNEQRKPAPKKATPKPATVKKTTKPTPAPVSDSDSDETDNESRKSVQRKLKKQQQKQQQQLSASDSGDTDAEVRNKSRTKVATTVGESSDSESDSDSDSGTKYNSLEFSKRKRGNLESNRISFRGKRVYDEKLSAAENVKDRLSDLFVPEVKDDYFVSDSESETDSGEDYDSREYPSWQRTLSIHHNQEKDPWPKQRAFGYSDKLKLEKRIKKICRRDGISFSQAQEIFSSNQRGQYLRFFQKIAKAFPDMSLHKLAKTCKDMYHKKKNTGPWAEDEIKNLKKLMKFYGSNLQLISEHMDRSPANISGYLMNHTGTDKKLSNKRWTKQEDELLAKEAVKYKDADKISFIAMEPLFKGTRSQKQIATRYYTLRHLIQPNGTIEKRRKATPYEELKYLNKLLGQVRENRLVEESQLNYSKDIGFVNKKFYLKKRAMIKGFEKMSVKDILKKLIEKQKQSIQSLREEKLLGSDPDADSH